MKELIRRIRMCVDVILHGDDMVLIDKDILDFYETQEEWDNMWFWLGMPPLDTEATTFRGLSRFVCKDAK